MDRRTLSLARAFLPALRRFGPAILVALLVASCASEVSTPSSAPPTANVTPSASPSGMAVAGLSGAWDGALVDPSGSWPARLTLEGCETVGAVCGGLEYLSPGEPPTVSCASDLTFEGIEGGSLILPETVVYQPWNCLPTRLRVRPGADGGLEVEQVVDDGSVCCSGTFQPIDPSGSDLPELRVVEGIGRATSVVALGAWSTQYTTSTDDSIWLPLDNAGSVARVDAASGAVVATTQTGDPGAVTDLRTDPHAVAAADGHVWVARAADRSVAPIDAATGVLGASIPIEAAPYALAIDGSTLWATSFLDDVVVGIDLATSKVIARIPASKPTGIAAGEGGIWVVLHRSDSVMRIDPATNREVATIALTPPGSHDPCSRCMENIVVAEGSVWTADNYARVVSRIDPATNSVAATITLPHRVWSVAAGGGSIWASQGESIPENDDAWDAAALGIARIDPATNEATIASYPVFSVSWGTDALWGLGPGRRGDLLHRIDVEP